MIQNIHAIRTGLFTPDTAFEEIVRCQIKKLQPPAVKCVDLVVIELIQVLRKCSDKMDRFPMLRDETDRIVSAYVREREAATKDQVDFLMQCEISYINTSHEDFVGLTINGNQQGTERVKKSNIGNQVFRKGWLTLHNISFMKGAKEFWFTLSAENLSWYKDSEENDKKFVLSLDGIQLRDLEKGFISTKYGFALFHSDSRNVYKDYKQLELSCESQEMVDSWKASFLRAGVYPARFTESNSTTKTSEDIRTDVGALDPQLERQVETIRNLVDSYMAIVNKTIRDLIPKVIMNSLIRKTKEFLSTEVLAHLYESGGATRLMEESPEEVERRENLLNMYDSLQEALKVMSELNLKTVHTTLPPPVDSSWISPSRSNRSVSSLASNKTQPNIPIDYVKKQAPPRPVPGGRPGSVIGNAFAGSGQPKEYGGAAGVFAAMQSPLAPTAAPPVPSRPLVGPPSVPRRSSTNVEKPMIPKRPAS